MRIRRMCVPAVQVKHMRVDIETCSLLSAGQTVCDVWGQSPLPRNCLVATVGFPARAALLTKLTWL